MEVPMPSPHAPSQMPATVYIHVYTPQGTHTDGHCSEAEKMPVSLSVVDATDGDGDRARAEHGKDTFIVLGSAWLLPRG